VKGGLAAGAAVHPARLLSIMALSWLYLAFGSIGPVAALFFGLKAAVLAIVFDAVAAHRRAGAAQQGDDGYRRRGVRGHFLLRCALSSHCRGRRDFSAGSAAGRALRNLAAAADMASAGRSVPDGETALGEALPALARAGSARPPRIAATFLFLWLAPVAAVIALAGRDSVFAEIALFFSQMAVVTFGGAYAVLAYVAQTAVETHGWLSAGEMLDGLGMAETTPGPLIMVTQFVGFLGAAREASGLSPFLAGTLGAILATWVTFTPCFLWIFAGAPFIERLRGNRALSAAMTAITAAVVGVILNLAVWFALHTLFAQVRRVVVGPIATDAPVLSSVDPAAAILSMAALVAVFRFKAGPVVTIIGCAAAGMLWWLLRNAG
jgi:chromate transporter